MPSSYRETIANIDLVAKGGRLTLRRSRASSLQMVVPIGVLGYAVLLAIRLARVLFQAAWVTVVWRIMFVVVALFCVYFYVFNRRRLVIGRDGTVRQGRKSLAFGPGLHVRPETQKNNATLLCGESPSLPLARLGDTPFFFFASEAETVAACVNDFLGHPRPDGVVEYPRPV